MAAEKDGLEIERKYLIEYPDTEKLKNMPGCSVVRIKQTYLKAEPGVTDRLRVWEENGKRTFIRTRKVKVDSLTAEEKEHEISFQEYESLYRSRKDPASEDFMKTRYRIPFGNHLLEVDVYDFWKDKAIAEIELESAEDSVEVPDCVTVIRDVTGDFRYKNASLAKNHNL